MTNFVDHMSSVGEVAYADLMKQYDGRSKGCGIVEFSNVEDAKKALETLHDSLLDGRTIFVREVCNSHRLKIIYLLFLFVRIEKDQTHERKILNSRTLVLAEVTTVDRGPRTRLPT